MDNNNSEGEKRERKKEKKSRAGARISSVQFTVTSYIYNIELGTVSIIRALLMFIMILNS